MTIVFSPVFSLSPSPNLSRKREREEESREREMAPPNRIDDAPFFFLPALDVELCCLWRHFCFSGCCWGLDGRDDDDVQAIISLIYWP